MIQMHQKENGTRFNGNRAFCHILKILLLVVCLSGCTHLSEDRFGTRLKEPKSVPLVALLVNPEAYHGEFVQTSGWAMFSFENRALYLSQDDGRHLISQNAIWFDFNKNMKVMEDSLGFIDKKWISVEGVFDAKAYGHLGAFPGTVREVQFLRILKKYY